MAAANAAVMGRSVTPAWLNPSQAAQVARIAVEKNAAASPNSRRSVR